MAKSYPPALAAEIVTFVRDGGSRREAARRFGVSPSFVVKLIRRTDTSEPENAPADEPAAPVFDLDQQSVTTTELADLLGVSKRSITEFADRGIIKRAARNRFHLRGSIQLYCEHLRSVAAGRGGDGSAELTFERARLAREQADGTALKNAVARRELVPVVDVEREWSSICRKIRNAVLAVPSRARQSLPHLTAYDVDLFDREIREALTGLADDDDRARLPEAGGVGQPAAAAETPPV